MQPDSVILVKNLNYYFGHRLLRKQILFDINFSIKSGEIVILTGPSGSGKTTLLTLLGALRSVQEGSLKVLNRELFKAKDRQLLQVRRHLGYIFQNHNLIPFLTTFQNVQMPLQ